MRNAIIVENGVSGGLSVGRATGFNKPKERCQMKYEVEKIIKKSRYANFIPTLPEDVRKDVKTRIGELIEDEKEYCDKGNFNHLKNIFTAIALYETLQKHGKGEEETFYLVSTEMWKSLNPESMQKLAEKSFFLPLMKKVVPFGLKHGSGYGWRYTWHKDDPKNEFHFECNECIYAKIFAKHNVHKLGPMFCRSDVINYGNLPYTDFVRTQTLCNGGECCDFKFVRYGKDEKFDRTDSI